MAKAKVQRENLTDLGNAERLVRRHGHQLRHVRAWGWLVWDGKRWLRDTTGEVERLAKATVRSIYAEAKDATNADDREKIAKHAVASERRQLIAAMMALAETELPIAAEAKVFDSNPWLLSAENGTVDLRTGELRQHDPADLLTKCATVRFDAAATAPRFEQFLEEIFAGDRELIAFVQRAVGYSLTGETREQCLFFLHGSGQNGKGALIRTLEALLGDHFQKSDFSTFLERRNDGIRNDIANLAGARLVAAEEAADGKAFAEGLVKNLTGQDTQRVRFLYQEEFQFRPQFKIWLAANHKPRIRGRDFAIWRRIHLIPFPVQVRPDHSLEPILQGSELPGILNWAIAGCLDWQRQGLQVPTSVRAATEAYRAEQDILGEFLAERCILDDEARETGGALYAGYQKWATDHGLRERERLNATAFGRELGNRNFDVLRRGGVVYRLGVRLRVGADGEADEAGQLGQSGHFPGKSSTRAREGKLPENYPNPPNCPASTNGTHPDDEAELLLELKLEREGMQQDGADPTDPTRNLPGRVDDSIEADADDE